MARRRLSKPLVVLVYMVAVGLVLVITMLLVPRPPARGSWYGTFTSPTGKRGVLELVLANRSGRGPVTIPSHRFKGSARLCVESPRAQRFEILGRTRGPGWLTLTPVDEPVSGPQFTHLDVTWESPRFAVAGTFSHREGDSSIRRADDPDHNEPTHIELKRGNAADFTAACDRLSS